MRTPIVIGAIAVILGALLLAVFLLTGPEPAPAPTPDAAVATAEVVPEEPPATQPLADPTAPMTQEERARLLAAIAQGVSQAQSAAAGEESEDLESRPPTPEERRALKSHVRAATRQLMRVVHDCLRDEVAKRPALANPRHTAKLTIEGAADMGSLVTKVELLGSGGQLDAPELQQCMEERAQAVRLAAPPSVGNNPGKPVVLSFPLISPKSP